MLSRRNILHGLLSKEVAVKLQVSELGKLLWVAERQAGGRLLWAHAGVQHHCTGLTVGLRYEPE